SNSANTYTGPTIISAGVVSVASLANGGANSSLGAATGASATITLGSASSATLSYTGSTTSSDRAITVGGIGGGTIQVTSAAATLTLAGGVNTAGAMLTFDTNGNVTGSGVISGAGGLTKSGSGTLWLTRDNTYGGTTTI